MKRLTSSLVIAVASIGLFVPVDAASAASSSQISRDSRAALKKLYAHSTSARLLGQRAKAILVFPKIIKAGFIVGGQGGNGALFEDGKTVGYYNTAAASSGLQVGVQSFGYALFFMDDEALGYLRKSDGWEIGTGPSVVIVDKGVAKSLSSTTLQNGVYAFTFKQKGLMAGVGIQGSKITRIHP